MILNAEQELLKQIISETKLKPYVTIIYKKVSNYPFLVEENKKGNVKLSAKSNGVSFYPGRKVE